MNLLTEKSLIKNWLDQYYIKNYHLDEDSHYGFTVSVDGDVRLSCRELTHIAVKFSRVEGRFSCFDNRLTNILGAPNWVGGKFDCEENQITSLEGGPQYVGGIFDCGYNQLTSLRHGPKFVGSHFYASYNQLTDLEHIPDKIKTGLSVMHNRITSLRFAPSHIDGPIYLEGNPHFALTDAISFEEFQSLRQIEMDKIVLESKIHTSIKHIIHKI